MTVMETELTGYFDNINGIPKKAVLTEELLHDMNSFMRLKTLAINVLETQNNRLMCSNAEYEKIIEDLITRVKNLQWELFPLKSEVIPLRKSNRKLEELVLFNFKRRSDLERLLTRVKRESGEIQFANRRLKKTLRDKDKLLRNTDAQLKTALKEIDREVKINKMLKKEMKRLNKK